MSMPVIGSAMMAVACTPIQAVMLPFQSNSCPLPPRCCSMGISAKAVSISGRARCQLRHRKQRHWNRYATMSRRMEQIRLRALIRTMMTPATVPADYRYQCRTVQCQCQLISWGLSSSRILETSFDGRAWASTENRHCVDSLIDVDCFSGYPRSRCIPIQV